jgi:hypothetical protein
MGFFDKAGNGFKKAVAGFTNPNKNNSLNQMQNEQQMKTGVFARDPNFTVPVKDGAGIDRPGTNYDEDGNGVADALETKHRKDYGDGKKPLAKLSPFSFKKPRKDYNMSFDKKGRYVPTATYPLPPVSHDKKMFAMNRRINNKDNKFF